MRATAVPEQRELLEILRGLTPQRALTPFEAKRVAELQAGRLLKIAGLSEPRVAIEALGELLDVRVVSRAGLPTSGLATTAGSGWVIVLSADDPRTRRAFSYAHELKHIIDDAFIGWLYPNHRTLGGDLLTERVCDQFAAALLMPRVWIKRDWGNGHQDVRKLAARYGVSPTAMSVRLGELGLRRVDAGHGRESLAYYTHHARRAS